MMQQSGEEDGGYPYDPSSDNDDEAMITNAFEMHGIIKPGFIITFPLYGSTETVFHCEPESEMM